MSRLIKKKITNYLINKGKKSIVEKLLKNSIKKLSQQNKKQFKNLTYLALNYSLPTFKLQKKEIKIKKIEKTKYEPFFIFKHKNRIFYAIKLITNSLKKNFITSFKEQLILCSKKSSKLVLEKNESHEKILMLQNILTFYRWYF